MNDGPLHEHEYPASCPNEMLLHSQRPSLSLLGLIAVVQGCDAVTLLVNSLKGQFVFSMNLHILIFTTDSTHRISQCEYIDQYTANRKKRFIFKFLYGHAI